MGGTQSGNKADGMRQPDWRGNGSAVAQFLAKAATGQRCS